jgi:hypothetical protein
MEREHPRGQIINLMEQQSEEEIQNLMGRLVILKPYPRYQAYAVTRPYKELMERPGLLVSMKNIPNIDGRPSINNYWHIWTGTEGHWIPTSIFRIIGIE